MSWCYSWHVVMLFPDTSWSFSVGNVLFFQLFFPPLEVKTQIVMNQASRTIYRTTEQSENFSRGNQIYEDDGMCSGASWGGGQGAMPPPLSQSRGREQKANTHFQQTFDNLFLKLVFKKHKQRGDPLKLFYGPSFQIELDAPLMVLMEVHLSDE